MSAEAERLDSQLKQEVEILMDSFFVGKSKYWL